MLLKEIQVAPNLISILKIFNLKMSGFEQYFSFLLLYCTGTALRSVVCPHPHKDNELLP